MKLTKMILIFSLLKICDEISSEIELSIVGRIEDKKIESQKHNIDFLIAENQKLKKTLEDVSYSAHEQLSLIHI